MKPQEEKFKKELEQAFRYMEPQMTALLAFDLKPELERCGMSVEPLQIQNSDTCGLCLPFSKNGLRGYIDLTLEDSLNHHGTFDGASFCIKVCANTSEEWPEVFALTYCPTNFQDPCWSSLIGVPSTWDEFRADFYPGSFASELNHWISRQTSTISAR